MAAYEITQLQALDAAPFSGPVGKPLVSVLRNMPYVKQVAPASIARPCHPDTTRAPGSERNDSDDSMLGHLHQIIEQRLLSAVYQPIIDMRSGVILGYEGLIRGPADSPLHTPMKLFKLAREHQLTLQVEYLCRRVVLESFAALGLPGKLFLNVSPECLLHQDARHGETLSCLMDIGISPERVIIELTESQPTYDYQLLRDAVRHYRAMGFQIAIDDLGEGFSSLRLWSELRPEYVKIDMHFVQGINHDPVKLQFVKSIQHIAEKSGTHVIAEGIESEAELLLIRDLGVLHGQGYHIARPAARPQTTLSDAMLGLLRQTALPAQHRHVAGQSGMATALKLLRTVPVASPDMQSNLIYDYFLHDPALQTIPVVDQGMPLGLINRNTMIDRFARLYQRELYGRKSCTFFMDAAPLVADQDTSLQDLSHLMVEAEAHHLSNGFIITRNGRYLGIGTGHDLMREITQMQIHAARYANPLTQLPGNVPINEHIERLLRENVAFHACYCDLDHFKPYNDVYGYRKGDDVIQLTGRILRDHCDPDRDFVGHIGGDDFMILFQSDDWETRCQRILNQFGSAIRQHYSAQDNARGGYISEDRQGKKVFYSLISLSLGVSTVEAGHYFSHHEIAAASTGAKKQAKKIHGNSLFIDRRSPPQRD